jgi:hypothetical protein
VVYNLDLIFTLRQKVEVGMTATIWFMVWFYGV